VTVKTAVRDVVRHDLIRSTGFRAVEPTGDEADDGQTIDGYALVFNQRTLIDSWEGTFEEEIHPGAAKRTLRENTPLMQYDHGRHPLIGTIPLGRWNTTQEEEHGARFIGRLTDNWLIQPVRDAIRDGGVTGMSFRFSVVREIWVDQAGKRIKPEDVPMALWDPMRLDYEIQTPLVRQLKELKISEAGPVAWPAYEQTSVGVRSVDGQRSVVIDLGTLDTDATRAKLARLIFMADTASRQHYDAPQASADRAGSHPSTTVEEPEPTQESAPGEHPSPADDALRLRRERAKRLASRHRGYLLNVEGTAPYADQPRERP
jgi:HK97 family phage prohead protease